VGPTETASLQWRPALRRACGGCRLAIPCGHADAGGLRPLRCGVGPRKGTYPSALGSGWAHAHRHLLSWKGSPPHVPFPVRHCRAAGLQRTPRPRRLVVVDHGPHSTTAASIGEHTWVGSDSWSLLPKLGTALNESPCTDRPYRRPETRVLQYFFRSVLLYFSRNNFN